MKRKEAQALAAVAAVTEGFCPVHKTVLDSITHGDPFNFCWPCKRFYLIEEGLVRVLSLTGRTVKIFRVIKEQHGQDNLSPVDSRSLSEPDFPLREN